MLWRNSVTEMVEKWNRDGGTGDQKWCINHGGTVDQLTGEQLNSHGGTVEHLMVE